MQRLVSVGSAPLSLHSSNEMTCTQWYWSSSDAVPLSLAPQPEKRARVPGGGDSFGPEGRQTSVTNSKCGFWAALSSSRSLVVGRSVCPCVSLSYATVVSNYRIYQVGLFWHCRTSKVHYFFVECQNKNKNCYWKIIGKTFKYEVSLKKIYFFLPLISFSPRHNIKKKTFVCSWSSFLSVLGHPLF